MTIQRYAAAVAAACLGSTAAFAQTPPDADGPGIPGAAAVVVIPPEALRSPPADVSSALRPGMTLKHRKGAVFGEIMDVQRNAAGLAEHVTVRLSFLGVRQIPTGDFSIEGDNVLTDLYEYHFAGLPKVPAAEG